MTRKFSTGRCQHKARIISHSCLLAYKVHKETEWGIGGSMFFFKCKAYGEPLFLQVEWQLQG